MCRKELNPGPKVLNTAEDFNLFTDNDDNQVPAVPPKGFESADTLFTAYLCIPLYNQLNLFEAHIVSEENKKLRFFEWIEFYFLANINNIYN